MGKDKQTGNSTTVVNQTQQATATPEEKRLNQLEIERIEATQPGQIALQQQGLDLTNKLLSGSTDLPGFFGDIGRGLSEEAVTDLSQAALRDLYPQLNAQGILDSGTAASVAARTAGDVRRASYEYNIGNKLNLLNLALSGQAQVQAPLLSQSATLGGRLAGLRSISTSGTTSSNTAQYGMNPFLKSFQTGFGGSLGERLGKASSSSIQTAFMGCWVAAEVFGGWNKPKTNFARFYITFGAPKWFRSLYMAYGAKFAKFISNKPFIKSVVKKIFNYIQLKGRKLACGEKYATIC